MVDINYKPEEYLALLAMSKHKHLLVEGKNDKKLFFILFNE
jgi:hypothetical protein